ncbi:MAG: SGNH/GDSL hydrolase family protein [Eubacteriales bacterium]|nr:SGNH/GDSL hydrolase family protein [Eubacteriales bacterium]
MEKRAALRWIGRFAGTAAVLLAAAGGLVALFDPFYHFHGPLPGMKAVVTKSEYQCIGTIRNFDYDSVIAGSSTAENYNNRWFDEVFGCTSVKAIKSSGTTADLKYYLDEAFSTHGIKNVFYSLDLFALDGDPDTNFVNDSMPLYLYDKNPLNDDKYLFNKDVLFEDIPYLLAMNLAGGYDEGTSYNFWQYKTFSEQEALSHYERAKTVAPMQDSSQWQERVDRNVELLTDMVQAHPETAFYFFLPPYSSLWWDSVYRSGQLEEYLYARSAAMEALTVFENVKLFDFQTEESIVTELDYYMDPIHFSADINRFMVEEAANADSVYLVRPGEMTERAARMRSLAAEMAEE